MNEMIGENGWRIKKIGDISSINPDSLSMSTPSNLVIKYIDIESVKQGKILAYKDFEFKNAPSRARRIVKVGDVIVSTVRPYLRAFAYITNEYNNCICSTGFAVLRAHEEYSTNYLYQYILSEQFMGQVLPLMVGSNYPAINNNDVGNITILIPKSITEQQRIAEILTTVDKNIEKTEALIEKYKNIKQGMMQDLLTKGIDDHGNIRSEETHEFKDSSIGRIPKEWDVFSLKDVSVVRQGLQIAIAKRYNSPAINRYIYITVQYLNSDRKNAEYIQSPNPNMICREDDILMTRTGNTGQVISDVEGVFHNNFFLIDYDRQLLNKDYLIYYLQKAEVQNFILGRAGVTTIPDLKHRDFYSIKINVPTLEEQERIVSLLRAIDNNICIETNSMGKLQSIKQALMQDLLTGKVQVPFEEATG